MEQLAILDCGGQYTKVIDRKVREQGVKSEIFPISVSPEKLAGFGAIILSGGPSSVWTDSALSYDGAIFELGVPVLGICYGMQLINQHFGGVVHAGVRTEYGENVIDIDTECPLFYGLEPKQAVLMSHGDTVTKIAPGFSLCAVSEGAAAAIYSKEKNIYGVQFHPEVDLTENSYKMFSNFLFRVCGFAGDYTMENRVQSAVEYIRNKVGDGNVLCLVSGGVDSAVTAALLLKALDPDRVFAVHVDHGLMRKGESDLICSQLGKLGLRHMVRENAEDDFFNSVIEVGGEKLGPLTKMTDPEKKRSLIGEMFIKVTQRACDTLHLDFNTTYLAQGTLRTDLIESGNPDVSSYANKIKTHHNDVDVIREARARGMVVETNWDWHKDEVRQVARMLGLGEEIASRQPFPGPGLGVRIMCRDGSVDDEASSEKREKLAAAARELKLPFDVFVAPVKSVGVQGDHRSYRNLCLAVSGASVAETDWDAVYDAARRIPNTVDFINRVCIAIDDNAADIAESRAYEMYINHETAELLREADYIVTKNLVNPKISQTFAVLLPMGTNKKYSIAIRCFCTSDFMTGRPAVVGKDFTFEALESTAKEIKKALPEVEFVLYDVTGKPPATVEWQ